MKHRPGNRSVIVLLFPALLAVVMGALVSCGPASVEDRLAEARNAMDADDHARAYEIYQGLLDANVDEDAIADAKRFQAALESSKCLVRLGRYDEAVSSFKKLETGFPDEMAKPSSYKYVLQICTPLLEDTDSQEERIIELIEYGAEKYEHVKEQFVRLKRRLLERDLPDELTQRLKTNPYLN